MPDLTTITHNARQLLASLPEGVGLVAAAKTRTAEEINAAVAGGITLIGQNYLQEARAVHEEVKPETSWHFIGHLQRRKVKQAVQLFDMIETVDSVELAKEIDKRCAAADKVMHILIEVNSGREPQKAGVMPDDVEALIRGIAPYEHIRIQGLMTMGPFTGDPNDARPYFVETRQVAEHIASLDLERVKMDHLSMGMSNSYRVAVDEGATMVRIGTRLFGPRSLPHEHH